MAKAAKVAGIKQVDEVHFFGGGANDAQASFEAKKRARDYFRDELASALGS